MKGRGKQVMEPCAACGGEPMIDSGDMHDLGVLVYVSFECSMCSVEGPQFFNPFDIVDGMGRYEQGGIWVEEQARNGWNDQMRWMRGLL